MQSTAGARETAAGNVTTGQGLLCQQWRAAVAEGADGQGDFEEEACGWASAVAWSWHPSSAATATAAITTATRGQVVFVKTGLIAHLLSVHGLHPWTRHVHVGYTHSPTQDRWVATAPSLGEAAAPTRARRWRIASLCAPK